jgi:hypothetical protein
MLRRLYRMGLTLGQDTVRGTRAGHPRVHRILVLADPPSGLIQVFGDPIKRFIDKYFDLCSLGFVGLLVLGFIVIRWL